MAGAIEAGSLVDLLIEEVDFELAIVAGSLVARELVGGPIHW